MSPSDPKPEIDLALTSAGSTRAPNPPASVRGGETEPESRHSTAERAQPRSGRGRQLTAQQHATLIHLCNSRSSQGAFAHKSKQFWVGVAKGFEDETGRPYSWQSCRRSMVRWETENGASGCLDPTIAAASLPKTTLTSTTSANSSGRPARAGHRIVSLVAEEDSSSAGDDGAEVELPSTPLVRRDVKASLEHENQILRVNIIDLVTNGMEAFETQLGLYMAAITSDPDDLHRINQSYTHFRSQMVQAMEKYESSRK